jgi:hypothetical protein
MNWPLNLTAYNKFIVAAVGLTVSLGLLDPGLSRDIIALLTAAGVLLIPNRNTDPLR